MSLFEKPSTEVEIKKQEALDYLNKKEIEAHNFFLGCTIVCVISAGFWLIYIIKQINETGFLLLFGITAVVTFLAAIGFLSDCRKLKKQRRMVYDSFETVEEEIFKARTKDIELEKRYAQLQADHESFKATIHAYDHPECPMCKSHNTRRISTINRATSVAAVGLASSKIGKQYECFNCKHKW